MKSVTGVKFFKDMILIFFVALTLNISCTQASSVNTQMSNIVEYDEVKNLPDPPEKFLFDVRNATEIEEIGSIPKAVNVPCKLR